MPGLDRTATNGIPVEMSRIGGTSAIADMPSRTSGGGSPRRVDHTRFGAGGDWLCLADLVLPWEPPLQAAYSMPPPRVKGICLYRPWPVPTLHATSWREIEFTKDSFADLTIEQSEAFARRGEEFTEPVYCVTTMEPQAIERSAEKVTRELAIVTPAALLTTRMPSPDGKKP